MFIVASLFVPIKEYAQGRRSGLLRDVSINVSTGVTSFYGDISDYDNDIIKKYTLESGGAHSIKIKKGLVSNLSFSTQVLLGNLKGIKVNKRTGNKYEFSTKLLEYNFAINYNISKAFSGRSSNFDFYIYAGMGQFFFHSAFSSYIKVEEEYKLSETREENTFKNKTPEFVYFFGAFAEYKVTDNIGLILELGLRQAHNDKLDARYYPGPNDNKPLTWDYYTNTSVGITYHFDKTRKGARWSNTSGRRGYIPPGRSRR